VSKRVVRDLVAEGVLRVEDGNHGNDRPRPDEFVEKGVAFIRAADMTSGVVDFVGAGKINDVARARIRKGVGAPGDVILSHKGTVGRVAVAPIDAPEFVCSPQTTFWRSLEPDVIDQRYLRYVLHSGDFQRQLRAYGGQTDMAPYVSLTDQRSISIEVPPVTEQRAIAEVLGALDDKIAVNNRVGVLIRELATGLFDDALRRLGTRTVTVGEIAEFHNRRRVPLSSRERELRQGTVPYYGAAGRVGYVDKAIFDERLLLVGEDGSVITDAGTPVFQYIWGPAWVNNHAHVLTGHGISTEVLRVALERANVSHLVTGAVQPKLNMGNLKKLEITIPDDLTVLDDRIQDLTATERALVEESALLAAARDELLPLLMSGNVRVKAAANAVEEVL
jgi:type I restriction enzyme S subunit